MQYIIGWLVVFLALVIIGIIVGRKFGVLANIDVNEVPDEKVKVLKQQIIADRLRRRFGKLRLFMIKWIKPLSKLLRNGFDSLYDDLNAWQRKQVNQTATLNQEIDKRIETLLTEAREALEAERFDTAEKKYIEIIGLEPKNFTAFRELGEVYYRKEDFNEAKQTLDHALTLRHKLSGEIMVKESELGPVYYLLAQVYEEIGDLNKATINLKRALKAEKNSPRYLDRLVEVSIMKKDKIAALDAYEKLKAANPENQKLEQFKARIAEL
jgi:tetratricopeptide (TPR) repeat protein